MHRARVARAQLGLLSDLREVRMSYSWLSGTIPPDMFLSPRFSELMLQETQVSGTLPQRARAAPNDRPPRNRSRRTTRAARARRCTRRRQ